MATPKTYQTGNGQSSEYAGLRIPPQAQDVERALIGALLLDSSSFASIGDLIDETAFYRPAHASIFAAMRALYLGGEPLDAVTVAEQLRRENKLEEVGGSLFLAELMETVGSAANVEHYAQTVQEKAVLRRLINLNSESIAEAMDSMARADTTVEAHIARLVRLGREHSGKRAVNAKQATRETYTYLEKIKSTPDFLTGVGSGFERLDEYTSGFRSGELVIIAARPSMGKTSLAMNIAQAAAEKHNTPVAVFSLEMDVQQLILRMLSGEAHMPLQRLRSNVKLSSQEWNGVVSACDRLMRLPMFFDDTAGITIDQLRSRARQLKHEHKIGMIVIDYLQLITPPKMPDNQQQWIAFVSASLKALAKDLELPIICLSQLSRAPETRGGDRKPMLSDLRDSGAIEQDADLVLFVYRPEVYKESTKKQKYEVDGKQLDVEGLAEIIVAKNRNGPTGHFVLSFLGKYTLFANYLGEGAVQPTAGSAPAGDEPDETNDGAGF